jgi:tyrosyl-tRNA synthetase
VARFLKLFTVLPLDEIDRLAALKGAEINEAKKILATKATEMVHGLAAAEQAAATARTTFEEGGLAETLPSVPIADLHLRVRLIDAVVKAELASSNGEARRLIRGGGIKVNDETASDEMRLLTPDDLKDGVVKLSLGRKRHVLLKPV